MFREFIIFHCYRLSILGFLVGLLIVINYRSQRSCGQGYVFTRVCDSVHRGVSPETPPGPGRPSLAGRTPPPRTRQTPLDQGDPPGTRQNPPGTRQTPRRQGVPPPQTRENPPPEEDCTIRSMSGRYASHWNAFLLKVPFL